MEKIITYEALSRFAYSNDQICTKPIKRIIINFYGLGGMTMYWQHNEFNTYLANEGIIFIHPYLNPWNWMNKEGYSITNEILDCLFEHYNLPEDLPIISTGGSMGGLCALSYCLYAKRTPHACVAICPVCDLPYHYTERGDLPRTLYSAFYNYEGTMEEALKSASPIDLAEKLPDIPYVIFHSEKDSAVNIDKHSVRFVEKMTKLGKNIRFIRVPDKDHCQLTDEAREEHNKLIQTI